MVRCPAFLLLLPLLIASGAAVLFFRPRGRREPGKTTRLISAFVEYLTEFVTLIFAAAGMMIVVITAMMTLMGQMFR